MLIAARRRVESRVRCQRLTTDQLRQTLPGEINLGGAVYTTPVAKDGVLYIATRAELYAIAAK